MLTCLALSALFYATEAKAALGINDVTTQLIKQVKADDAVARTLQQAISYKSPDWNEPLRAQLTRRDEQIRQEQERVRLAEEAAKKAAEEKAKPIPVAPVVQPVVSGSCHDWMIAAGVTDLVNAAELIKRESGCNPTATNRSSGAFGIPQSLPASKIAHCGVDPVCQIQWMQNYVNARYGGWAGAVAWHNRMNWY